jgi:glyoxylase-like metal-dependent hydrolase (beta-lactamase superfamily II)
MTSSTTPTAYAVSPDSGEHWTAEGAWEVAPGIHRIPLPLPMDGLKAVNVYVLATDDGLTLIDGGWAIPVAREVFERSLGLLGAGFGDIRRFLVTHMHRDHYSLARVLGTELGIDVALGRGEQASLDSNGDFAASRAGDGDNPFAQLLVAAGAADVAERWRAQRPEALDPVAWAYPDTWLEGDHTVAVGARTLDAVQTPGHTPGHYVFADRAEGVLFAGDHVLPTITPSIGFIHPVPANPLGDFMASLTKVRGLPDLRVLPAHGPVSPSAHARVDELLTHHEHRLAQCLRALVSGPQSAASVAGQLGWTRHEHPFADLDPFNQGMAVMETKAHLEVLVARGQATRSVGDGVTAYVLA